MSRQTDPFEQFQREVERLFHDLVYRRHPATHFADPNWQPAVDVVASESGALVRVELAGISRHDFQVTLQGNLMRVFGRRRPPRDLPPGNYHRAEIFYGPFQRIIELPWPADHDRIEAHYREGILEIHLTPTHIATATEVPIEEEGAE